MLNVLNPKHSVPIDKDDIVFPISKGQTITSVSIYTITEIKTKANTCALTINTICRQTMLI